MSLERIPFSLMLCQTHRGEERKSCNTVASLKINKPSPLLLEYTFTRQSVLLKNSIETGFGGFRLKPTIIQTEETITNVGNLIPVKVNKTHTVDVHNFGIVALPINTMGDGSIHQTFDLTHGLLRLVDFLRIQDFGCPAHFMCHLVNWHTENDRH